MLTYILNKDDLQSRSSHVRLSVYLPVRMKAEISETTKARKFGKQIPELLAQRKFVSSVPID